MLNVQSITCVVLTVISVTAGLGQDWVNLTPTSGPVPTGRTNAMAIYDSPANRIILFGGKSANGTRNDVWAFDLNTNSWTEITPSEGSVPSPRLTPRGAFYAPTRQMLVWSGQGNGLFNDVWTFDLANETWTELQPPDPKPKHCYLFRHRYCRQI